MRVDYVGTNYELERLNGHNVQSTTSGLGQKQTSGGVRPMSAVPPKADIDRRGQHVRFVPILLQKSVEVSGEP